MPNALEVQGSNYAEWRTPRSTEAGALELNGANAPRLSAGQRPSRPLGPFDNTREADPRVHGADYHGRGRGGELEPCCKNGAAVQAAVAAIEVGRHEVSILVRCSLCLLVTISADLHAQFLAIMTICVDRGPRHLGCKNQ